MKQTEDKGKCRCESCKQDFRRLSGFDRHRYGPYTDRRCLTETAMLEMGFWKDLSEAWGSPPETRGGKPRPARNWRKLVVV